MEKIYAKKINVSRFFWAMLFFVFFLAPQWANAQKKVSGTLTDASNEPLIGVSIQEKGTGTGAITDLEGKYEIMVQSESSILVFTSVGFEPQEVAVGAQNVINVVMKTSDIGVDEVVVVGYGTIKKSNLTGSISSIKSESIEKAGAINPVNAMQGQVAGVTVQKYGGAPGAGSAIRIRGIGTIGDNAPLYIIDGVPGSLDYLNPDDIESIEVLKDGAAAAIYGSRAANGVILVTTKSGKKGKVEVDFKAYAGVVNQVNQFDMANRDEYLKVATMMYQNAGQALPEYIINPSNNNTDWQKEVSVKNAVRQNYNLRVSGASESFNYSVSGLFADEQGSFIGSGFTKSAIRANGEIKKTKFKIRTNLSYTETATEPIKFNIREDNEMLPLIPVYDPSQEYGFGMASNGMPSTNNPVGLDFYKTELTKTQYTTVSIAGDVNIIKGLDYKINLGYQNSNDYTNTHAPKYQVNLQDPNLYPTMSDHRSNWTEQTMEHLLTYNLKAGKHSIDLLAGYTASSEKMNWMQADVVGKTTIRSVDVDGNIVETEVPAGFLDESFNTLNSGFGGTYSASGSQWVYNRTSVLGRLNYGYNDKYLIQATFRRDGSSKFGPDSKYGNFPSFAAAWKLHNEGFMKSLTFLNELKLRASWGKLGNEVTLGPYSWMPLITSSESYTLGYVQGGGNHWPGSIAQSMENKDLHWEETKTVNIGLDFGLFDSQISGSLNYYNKITDDMLVEKMVPLSSGLLNPFVNIGKIKNQGLELELSYKNGKKDFKYQINGTFATIKNKVLKLAAPDQQLPGEGLRYGDSHFVTSTREGTEIGAFFLYETDGIFQTDEEAVNYVNSNGERLQPNAKAGDIKFKNTNNDGVIDALDKTYQGSGIPKVEYSLSFNADYKGFDLSLMLYGVGGNKIYNGNKYYYQRMESTYNFLASSVNAWTPSNTNTDIPRAVLGDPNGNSRESTRFLENGSFLRLKNIQLGYNLPKSALDAVKIERCRLYVSGENLLTITKYTGLDPEVGRESVGDQGVDRAFYPMVKTILFGLQITF